MQTCPSNFEGYQLLFIAHLLIEVGLEDLQQIALGQSEKKADSRGVTVILPCDSFLISSQIVRSVALTLAIKTQAFFVYVFEERLKALGRDHS